MWSKCLLGVFGFAASTIYAQSVSNDIPANQTLTVVFGDGVREIHAPGAQLHPGYLNNAPNISTPSWPSSSDPGLLIMLDLDAPYQNTRVSSLHWLVTGLTLSSPPSSPDKPSPLTLPPAQVAYHAPEPPVGDIAHTYAIYLLAPVPPSLDNHIATLDLAAHRTPFDLARFLLDARLQPGAAAVVARNHFRVRNLKGTPTALFPGPRASETAPSVGGGAWLAASGAASPTAGEGAALEGVAGSVGAQARGALVYLMWWLLLLVVGCVAVVVV